jgi:hypothetical protein
MVTSETPSTQLLGPDGFRAPTPMRTARIVGESGDDIIKTMARNQKALTQAQTPLLGQDIQLEGTVEFTRSKAIATTPNSLAQMTPSVL